MHTIIKTALLLSLVIFFSCKKSSYNEVVPTAALNVINAATDVPALSVNFTRNPISFSKYQQLISYGASWEWGLPPLDTTISLISSADTSNIFYSSPFSFKAGKIYSLYVVSGAAKGDILFMEDSIPAYQDSAAGIRFINLSPDSGPVTINMQGSDPGQTEFQEMAFKQISPFKKYSIASPFNGAYNFEIWSKTTNTLLANFTWSCRFQRNHTAVISGSIDPSSLTPINVFPVNNY
jgi:hypothetical protein